MINAKLKEKVLRELFPFAIQAVYNAYKTLSFELSGQWWQLPDYTLLATKMDCDVVLEILRYCGLKAPQYMSKDGNLVHIDRRDVKACMKMFVWEHMQIEKIIETRAQELCNISVKQKIKEYRENIVKNTSSIEMDMYIRQRLIHIRNQMKKDYEEKFQEEAEVYAHQKFQQIEEEHKSEICNLKKEIEDGYKNQEIVVAQMLEKAKQIEQLEMMFYEFSSLYEKIIPDAATLRKIKKMFKKIQNKFAVLKKC